MNLSELDIINGALDLVGAGSIGTLGENSTPAAKCRRHWPLTRQYVFEVHPWKCITKQVSLSTTTTAPLFGFDCAYPVPADFVRMNGLDAVDGQYKVYERVLHTDDAPALLDYVYLCTDTTKYTAALVQALQLHLAYKLALALRQDAGLAQQILGDLERFFLPVIRHSDATGQGVRNLPRSTLTGMFQ